MNRRTFLANAGAMLVASSFVPDFVMYTNKVSSRISKLAPRIFWVSDPVRPNEAVVLMGDGFIHGVKIDMARAENGKPAATDWRSISPLQVETQTLKAIVPADWRPGMFAFRVRVGDIVSNTLVAKQCAP